jgi:hypothetical protein
VFEKLSGSTVAHPKYDTGLLNRRLHLQAIIHVCGHGLLAKDMVALLCKGEHDLEMHVILHGDDDSVTETLAYGGDGLCGCLVQVLPGVEDKGLVNGVS